MGKEQGSHQHPWEVGWLWAEAKRVGSAPPLYTIVSGGPRGQMAWAQARARTVTQMDEL